MITSNSAGHRKAAARENGFSLLLMIGFLLLPVFPLLAESGSANSLTVWFTADVEGYLVGCDCPSGDSAGISALAIALEERDKETELLVDAGGYREPFRSDELLEYYMDEAALELGYSGMIAVTSDLRDGIRSFRKRSRLLPISTAGGAGERGLLQGFFSKNRRLEIYRKGQSLSLISWIGAEELIQMEDESNHRLAFQDPMKIADYLTTREVDYQILVVRGDFDDWESFRRGIGGHQSSVIDSINLILFTGPESPGYPISNGGVSGNLGFGKTSLPWLSLAPRGNGLASVIFAAGDDPVIEIRSLIRGEAPESPKILGMGDHYMEELIASALAAANGVRRISGPAGEKRIKKSTDFELTYWYPFGCKTCEDFLWKDIPALEKSTGVTLSILERDTGNPDDFEELLSLLKQTGVELTDIPVMLVSESILQGDEDIRSGLEEIIRGGSLPVSRGSGSAIRWEPGAVFLAGLLDGVNPCAFSAMVFLVSALAMAGRSRKMMLGIGLFYALGVLVTYTLVGAGLLGGLKRIAVSSGIRRVLEYALAGFLLVLSVLSLVDGMRLSKGRTDLLLKLPEKLSGRVHKLIREEVRSGAAAGGALLLGAAVAVIELGCTGQVYLPTIAWMISRGEGATPWLWLGIYNSAFIIPLLIVFVVSYKGVSAIKLAAAFQKRGAGLKFITAGLLVLLAVVVFVA